MILIDSDTIGNAAPINQWMVAMEKAFIESARGKVHVPKRMHVDRGDNSLILMPCFGDQYFSTKLVSVYPGNLRKNKPVIYGTVVLNDAATGKPLASLDGGKLTAMRTAAVGAVGVRYLAPENADTLGIIGLGIQGFHQALFVCQTRRIRTLRILDRSQAIMDRFTERFSAYYKDVKVVQCKTPIELCLASKIIITATGSRHPVVPRTGNWWKGKTLIGIGSYKPNMREFPDELLADVGKIYVDTLHGLTEAGDLLVPLEKGIIEQDNVLPIHDLILEDRKAGERTRFFKSVGMAAFDLYGASLVYESIHLPA